MFKLCIFIVILFKNLDNSQTLALGHCYLNYCDRNLADMVKSISEFKI